MRTPLIALSGPMAAGKSTLARELRSTAGAGVLIITTHGPLDARVRTQSPTRRELQDAGTALDRETGGRWVLEHCQDELGKNPGTQPGRPRLCPEPGPAPAHQGGMGRAGPASPPHSPARDAGRQVPGAGRPIAHGPGPGTPGRAGHRSARGARAPDHRHLLGKTRPGREDRAGGDGDAEGPAKERRRGNMTRPDGQAENAAHRREEPGRHT